jgi:hypothetical protein
MRNRAALEAVKKNAKFLEELIAYVPLMRYEPQR